MKRFLYSFIVNRQFHLHLTEIPKPIYILFVLGGPHCVSEVVWGLGIKLVYFPYVEFKQRAANELRRALIQQYNVNHVKHELEMPIVKG